MSFDTAKRVSFRAIVWNEGETPIELLWEGLTTSTAFSTNWLSNCRRRNSARSPASTRRLTRSSYCIAPSPALTVGDRSSPH